jgi:dUTP pyrophosphatase
MSRFVLQVKKLSETAMLPARATTGSAGYDLFASKAGSVPARGKALIATDISIAVPEGTYGRIGKLLVA